MDELDQEFEEMQAQCAEYHHWDFPVRIGDWCQCGQKRWGDE